MAVERCLHVVNGPRGLDLEVGRSVRVLRLTLWARTVARLAAEVAASMADAAVAALAVVAAFAAAVEGGWP